MLLTGPDKANDMYFNTFVVTEKYTFHVIFPHIWSIVGETHANSLPILLPLV